MVGFLCNLHGNNKRKDEKQQQQIFVITLNIQKDTVKYAANTTIIQIEYDCDCSSWGD